MREEVQKNEWMGVHGALQPYDAAINSTPMGTWESGTKKVGTPIHKCPALYMKLSSFMTKIVGQYYETRKNVLDVLFVLSFTFRDLNKSFNLQKAYGRTEVLGGYFF